jgi:predicted lipoprotein with Yx(FWY)xxD motif
VRSGVAGVLAMTALGGAGLWASAAAAASTPAESVVANFESGPFHIQFNASRAANAPADAASGNFAAHVTLGSATAISLAGPVTCLDVRGNEIGLFYPAVVSDPALIYDAFHGFYIYVTESSAGTPLYAGFIPSFSGRATSCTPIPGFLPITSGTVTTTNPTATVNPLVASPASSHRATLQAATNATLNKTIVVDSRGRTVYELSPESTHHLLCTKANGCFGVWTPFTVPSARTKLSAAHGIKGKLGILHRDGFFQVTLGGHPLYHFAGDQSTSGSAKGQGIRSFGGTWHTVAATATTSTPAPTSPTPTPAPPTPTPPGYSY